MFARSRSPAARAIFCRRLIAGMAAVTYMQPGVKAKSRGGARGDRWRGITMAAALRAAVGTTAAGPGRVGALPDPTGWGLLAAARSPPTRTLLSQTTDGRRTYRPPGLERHMG